MDMIWFAALTKTYIATRSCRSSGSDEDYDRFMLMFARRSWNANALFIYLEKPEYGEKERDDERHRQVRQGMTADNRADRLEERR